MKILKIKENKNGSGILDIELDKKDEELFKEIAKLQNKKYSREFIKITILKAIKNYVK